MTNIHIEQIRDDLTWHIRQEAMYPNLPLEEVKLDNDHEGVHFGLFADNRLTSVVSLFNEGTVYRFRKFATVPGDQGKGFGTALLSYIIDYVTSMGATKLWCNARASAGGFYHKFGFIETDETSRKHGLDFVIMELQLDNSLGA
jgi:GNAT superfamily N-acetyltransferase